MAKKIERNDPCWCGSGKKYKKCHEAFDEKMELMKKKGYAVLDHDLIKTPAQIEKIKESCKINIAVLDYVAEHIGPGVTTHQIDDWVHEETVRHVEFRHHLIMKVFQRAYAHRSTRQYAMESRMKRSF